MVTMGMVGSSNKIRSKHIFQWKKKESPLDSIVTNLGPSKYTHRSPSKI
jgi:hypothetical protein